MSKNSWRKDYNSFYKKHLEGSSQVYEYERARNFIISRTDLKNGSGETLLDVGCGDGTWSVILDEWYDVTGIDNSEVGIECCAEMNNRYNCDINFICGDVASLDKKYDIVWCRGPEFFGSYPPDSKIFQKFLKITMNLCRSSFYFVVYSKPPFETYNKGKTSYYHDPAVLEELFSAYGDVSMEYDKKYIVVKVRL